MICELSGCLVREKVLEQERLVAVVNRGVGRLFSFVDLGLHTIQYSNQGRNIFVSAKVGFGVV